MTKERQRILIYFFIFYCPIALVMVFGLKRLITKKFSEQKLEEMMLSTSQWRDITDDLCRYEIKGDPKEVGKDYVKIDFWCKDGRSARSTMAFKGIPKQKVRPSYEETIDEYARVIGFEVEIIEKQGWLCFLNNKPIENTSIMIDSASDIDCYQDEATKNEKNI